MKEFFCIGLILLALFLAAMFVPEFFSSRWQKKQNEKFRQAVQNGYMTALFKNNATVQILDVSNYFMVHISYATIILMESGYKVESGLVYDKVRD